MPSQKKIIPLSSLSTSPLLQHPTDKYSFPASRERTRHSAGRANLLAVKVVPFQVETLALPPKAIKSLNSLMGWKSPSVVPESCHAVWYDGVPSNGPYLPICLLPIKYRRSSPL